MQGYSKSIKDCIVESNKCLLFEFARKPLIILVPLTESIRFSLLHCDNIIPMRAAFAACNNMLRDKVCKLVIVFVKICVVYGV